MKRESSGQNKSNDSNSNSNSSDDDEEQVTLLSSNGFQDSSTLRYWESEAVRRATPMPEP